MEHIEGFPNDACSTIGLNNYIARELSPKKSYETVRTVPGPHGFQSDC